MANIGADVEVKANFAPQPVRYTVTFVDGQGNTLKTEKVESGKAATPPADDPTRDGYTFDGWDKDFSKVTGNMILYIQKII